MSSANLFNLRKPLPWLLAAAAGAALFAAGVVVARATIDDGAPAAPDQSNRIIAPGIGTDSGPSPARPAGYGANDTVTEGGRGGTAMPYPGCEAPLPAGVIANGVIDPAKGGFVPALPTSGFTPSGVNLSSSGDCQPDGAAKPGGLMLNSSWFHDRTGISAYISQRASETKVASVLRTDGASFWSNGYEFNIGINAYRMLPVAGGSPVTEPGPALSTPARPGAPEQSALTGEVLRELLDQIAPGLDQKCFWTMASGDWSSLAGAGIGDPRPAIPNGYMAQEMNVVALVPPAEGCDTTLKPLDGFSFNAGWQKGEGNDFSYIGVNVYGNASNEAYPGQLNEYGANWSNGTFSFGVFAKSEKPLGVETIKAIARALDPTFNEACFVRERELKDSELAGFGFHAARAPQGYELARSSLRAQDIADGCSKPAGFEASYNLSWSFEKGADTIEAWASRYGSGAAGDGSGYRAPNSLNWVGADGTNYSINAYSRGISPTVPMDDLVSVAKSMDPAFDISKLTEGGPVKPMPAETKPR